jgi:hypothetical protein
MTHRFFARDGLPLSAFPKYETNPRPPILVCPRRRKQTALATGFFFRSYFIE